MSRKQGGPYYIKGGAVGDFTHYYDRTKKMYLVSKKGGVDGETVRTSPDFARTRRAMDQFKVVAQTTSKIFEATSKLNESCRGNRTFSRLFKIIYNEAKKGPGKMGTKDIMLTDYALKINGFDINDKVGMDDLFSGNMLTFSKGPDKVSATITLKACRSSEVIGVVNEYATHMRLKFAVGFVSNRTYIEQADGFEPVNASADGVSSSVTGDYVKLDETMTSDLTLTSSVGDMDTESGLLVGTLIVEFFSEYDEKDGGKGYDRLSDVKAGRLYC